MRGMDFLSREPAMLCSRGTCATLGQRHLHASDISPIYEQGDVRFI